MFIKLKDFACSSRESISALSADITQKRHYISTRSADMTTLCAIRINKRRDINERNTET